MGDGSTPENYHCANPDLLDRLSAIEAAFGEFKTTVAQRCTGEEKLFDARLRAIEEAIRGLNATNRLEDGRTLEAINRIHSRLDTIVGQHTAELDALTARFEQLDGRIDEKIDRAITPFVAEITALKSESSAMTKKIYTAIGGGGVLLYLLNILWEWLKR